MKKNKREVACRPTTFEVLHHLSSGDADDGDYTEPYVEVVIRYGDGADHRVGLTTDASREFSEALASNADAAEGIDE